MSVSLARGTAGGRPVEDYCGKRADSRPAWSWSWGAWWRLLRLLLLVVTVVAWGWLGHRQRVFAFGGVEHVTTTSALQYSLASLNAVQRPA